MSHLSAAHALTGACLIFTLAGCGASSAPLTTGNPTTGPTATPTGGGGGTDPTATPTGRGGGTEPTVSRTPTSSPSPSLGTPTPTEAPLKYGDIAIMEVNFQRADARSSSCDVTVTTYNNLSHETTGLLVVGQFKLLQSGSLSGTFSAYPKRPLFPQENTNFYGQVGVQWVPGVVAEVNVQLLQGSTVIDDARILAASCP